MPTSRKTKKTNWSDIGDLRKPHAAWRLGKIAEYFESILGLEPGAVVFVHPTGERARSDMKLGSLRSEWQRHVNGS